MAEEYRIAKSLDGFTWFISREDSYLPVTMQEYLLIEALKELGGKDRVFVDVGAHVGEYSVRLARHYRKVYAFEPNPESYYTLLKNIELNKLNNIKVYMVALGEKRCRSTLYVRGGSSTLLPVEDADKTFPVEVYTMDEVIDRADVVKIDVEGCEYFVLQGMKRILRECKPTLLIEHHKFRGYTNIEKGKESIKKFLKGYLAIDLDDCHTLYVGRSDELNRMYTAVWIHWSYRTFKNLANGKPWYFGLPYTWWWGYNQLEFILALKARLRFETEWFDIIKRDCVLK